MVRVVEQEGRIAPRATQVDQADRQFGGMAQRSVDMAGAPVDAFGDPSGKMAIANGLMQAGNAFFDVGARNIALKKAEEETRMRANFNKLQLAEGNIRVQLEQEAREITRTPDEKLSEYHRRVEAAQKEIFGDAEFKYYDQSFIERETGIIREARATEYLGGQIEKDIGDAIRGQTMESIDALQNNAALAGKALSFEQLNSTLHEIKQITSDPKTVSAFGIEGAVRLEAGAVKDAIKRFVVELAEIDPEGALAMINNEESPLSGLIAEEDLNLIREDLEGIITTQMAQRETMIRTQQAKYTDELGYGIQDIFSVTGKRTTRTDITQARDRGDISSGDAETLLSKLRAREEQIKNEAERKKQSLTLIQHTLATGGTLADVPESQKAINDHFLLDRQVLAERLDAAIKEGASGEELVSIQREADQKLVAQIVQLGRMPDGLIAELQGALRRPDDAASGAQRIMHLVNANPRLLDQFPESTVQIAQLVQAGTPVDEAQQLLRRESQMTVTEREAWKETAELHFPKVENVSTTVGKQFGVPSNRVPANASMEWRQMYERNLMRFQDHDVAVSHTHTMFSQKWSSSNNIDFQGDKMIIGSPERIHAQAKDILRLQMKNEFDLAPGEYALAYNPASSYSQPSYHIMVMKQDGMMQMLMEPGTNKPFVWDLGGNRQEYEANYQRWMAEERKSLGVFVEEPLPTGMVGAP